jgi:hypothetical protein
MRLITPTLGYSNEQAENLKYYDAKLQSMHLKKAEFVNEL